MNYFYIKCLNVLFELNWKRDINLNRIYQVLKFPLSDLTYFVTLYRFCYKFRLK